MNAYKLHLIECFDFTDYDTQPKDNSIESQVETAYKIFLSEMGWQLKSPYNKPLAFVCQEWLQGLASACTVNFMNGSILLWAENKGLLAENASEKKQDQFLDNYWLRMGANLASMFQRSENGYKIV